MDEREALSPTDSQERDQRTIEGANATKRKQLAILALFGTIDFDPAFDYKADRKRER
jgi:hypothetical protein